MPTLETLKKQSKQAPNKEIYQHHDDDEETK